MKLQEYNIYRRLRNAGYRPSEAIRDAKIIAQFKVLEQAGQVRIVMHQEEESYFDVFDKPEGYTDGCGRRITPEQAYNEILDLIDRWGCWWICTEWMDALGEWQQSDSIGMSIYENPMSPFENCYVPDLMKSALTAVNMHIAELVETF